MWLRASVVLAFAVVLMVLQVFASTTAGERFRSPSAELASAILGRSVAAQDDDNDNNANDNESNNNDGDDDDIDGDNGDEDGDNGEGDDDDDDDGSDDNDNDDDDGGDDNDNDDDDGDGDDNDNEPVTGIEVGPAVSAPDATPLPTPIPVTPTATPRPTRTPTPTPVPTTEDQVVTTGGDVQVTLTGDRVVVQVFSTTPAGIVLTLRLVDPAAYPGPPGTLVGDLIFQVEARDQQGAVLSQLPAEVYLSVRYTDADLAGRDDAGVTLARLDPADNQWKAAPRLLTDPGSNFVAATIGDLGVYVVSVP